ncbi:MAG: type II toxin-antitoxin system PemK/MazF family toxin [Rhodoferax sp.]|uniref:type II toxin-antitoxin system PemK/MazF family toxin n=1 Tax=Rhodoferax sp. TaxID=50421 RepID=UPI003BB68E7E
MCIGSTLTPPSAARFKKTRPTLVVSPDDMDAELPRVIIAPITSAGRPLGCRPEVIFAGKSARILLGQVRCVDKIRLGKKMGKIDEKVWHGVLLEMLA